MKLNEFFLTIIIFLVITSYVQAKSSVARRTLFEKSKNTISSYTALAISDTSATLRDTVGACLYGVQSAMTPAFCWKRKRDRDTYRRPIICPTGTWRKFRKCVENCRDGEEYKNGQCRQPCAKGFKPTLLGSMCRSKKYFIRKYPREGREPEKKFPACKDGYHALGRRCKKSCEWGRSSFDGALKKGTGLVDCGPLACASSKRACGLTIANMIWDTISVVMDALLYFTTAGFGNLVKSGVIKGLKEIGKNKLAQEVKTTLVDLPTETFKRKAKNFAIDHAKGYAMTKFVAEGCNKIIDLLDKDSEKIIENVEKTSEKDLPAYLTKDLDLVEFTKNNLDILNVQGLRACYSSKKSNMQIILQLGPPLLQFGILLELRLLSLHFLNLNATLLSMQPKRSKKF